MAETARKQVYELIDGERLHQDVHMGPGRHEVGAWLAVLHRRIELARQIWCDCLDDEQAMREVRNVAAVAVAALEQHGAPAREWPVPHYSPFAGGFAGGGVSMVAPLGLAGMVAEHRGYAPTINEIRQALGLSPVPAWDGLFPCPRDGAAPR